MNDDVRGALTNLIAIERDRQLGYPSSELHMDPGRAIEEALEVLSEHGYDPNEIVWPADQDALGLEVPDE